jgi:DNA ligase-1
MSVTPSPDGGKALLAYPCFAQPKLNGLRAIYKNGRFYSRSGNQWADTLLGHITEPLRQHCDPRIILDGEFYCHGWTLDRIAEAVSLFRRKPDQDTFEIGFYVFDLVADLAFAERCTEYHDLITGACNHVQPVPALRADSEAAGDAIHQMNLRAGFEGTIFRTGTGGYRPGRNSCLMKRKPRPGSGFTAERLDLMRKKQQEYGPRANRWHLVS